jgi:histidinol phosphatase-like enzyme
MKQEGAKIDAIYYCPHHPKEGQKKYKIECTCRKPKPGMILKAVQELRIDLRKSYMVGDRYKDILFAKNLKIKSCFVFTGYGRGEYLYDNDKWKEKPDFVGENLLDIARQIQSNINKNLE